VPDAVPASSPAEAASPDESATQPSRKTSPSSRKKVGKKASRRSSPQTSKRAAGAGSSEKVKVGSHTIVVPMALATDLTPKDLKKLRAIFKRARKRGKKRSAEKRAAKDR